MPYLYDTREAWLNAFRDASTPIFADLAGVELPANLRLSVGYSPNSRAKKGMTVVACWIPPEASADGHHEIFISPDNATDVDIAAAVTHELVHAVHGFVDGVKRPHGKRFGLTARALGLEGPLTETVPGQAWFNWAAPVLEALGPCPYAAIDLGKSGRKTKATSLARLDCPSCGWLAQVSKKHVDPYDYLSCPVPHCDGVLVYHRKDDDADGDGE